MCSQEQNVSLATTLILVSLLFHRKKCEGPHQKVESAPHTSSKEVHPLYAFSLIVAYVGFPSTPYTIDIDRKRASML